MALGVDFRIVSEPTTVLNRSFPEALVNGGDDGTRTRGLSPFHAWGLFIPFQIRPIRSSNCSTFTVLF